MKYKFILLFSMAHTFANGQCGNTAIINTGTCFNNDQLYTRTTNPNDNSNYSYTANSFNYILTPYGVNRQTEFK
jgi:hypothetical protein